MADLFKVSARDLLDFERLMRKNPARFRFATASVLNTFAFGTRTKSEDIINAKMNVRNKRFVKGRLRVIKADGKLSINKQQSEAGSVATSRFSAWKEQEEGTATKRTRVGTKFGRSGDWNKQLQGQARLKPNQKFVSPSDIVIKNVSNRSHRMTVFLNIMQRRKKRQSFLIPRAYKNFKKGLYRFKRGKIERLQSFEPKRAQPKRLKWLTMAREQFMSSANIPQIWKGATRRIFK